MTVKRFNLEDLKSNDKKIRIRAAYQIEEDLISNDIGGRANTWSILCQMLDDDWDNIVALGLWSMQNFLRRFNFGSMSDFRLSVEMENFLGLKLEKWSNELQNIVRILVDNSQYNAGRYRQFFYHVIMLNADLFPDLLKNIKYLDYRHRSFDAFPKLFREIGTIQTLNYSNSNLKELPNQILLLRGLREIILNHNQLRAIPEKFTTLPVEHCELINNKLKTFTNFSFNTESLGTINLSKNYFKVFPPELESYLNLKVLLISQNRISEIPDWIQGLSELEELDLSQNKLSHLPKFIFELPRLRILDLSNNNIENIPKAIKRLTSIEHLNLRGNKLNDLPKEFCSLKTLIKLDLQENKISKLPAEIHKLHSLEILNLNNNKLTDLPPRFVFKRLMYLYLDYNYLSKFPYEAISTQLVQMSLEHNIIHQFTLPQISGEMEEINLSHNNMTEVIFTGSTVHTGKIQKIDLSHNNLEKIPSQLVESFPAEIIILHNNNIKEVQSSKLISTLYHIERFLELSNNDLQDFPQLRLQEKTTIKLSHNGFSDIPISLAGLPAKSKVDLTKNPLEKVSSEFLSLLNPSKGLLFSMNEHPRIIEKILLFNRFNSEPIAQLFEIYEVGVNFDEPELLMDFVYRKRTKYL